MKTWKWAVLLAGAAVVLTLLSVWLLARRPAGGLEIAGVYSDGALLVQIDVKNPENWRDYTVSFGDQTNTVRVDAGGIRVVQASCPDGLCVRQGYLRNAPVVCLPNRLVVKWISAATYDAIA